MKFNLKECNFRRLFYPEIIFINKPGIIISKNSGLFRSGPIVMRSIFNFNEIYHDLYLNSIKEFGLKKNEDLSYRVGKDMAIRYFYFYRKIRVTKSNIKNLLHYFSINFVILGIGAFESIESDFKNGLFVFNGKTSVVGMNTKNFFYIAGFISGMISFLLGRNIEAKSFYSNYSNKCKVVCSIQLEKKYLPKSENVILARENISYIHTKKSFFSNSSSFSDFLKFEIIKTNNKKYSFMGKSISSSEAGLPSILMNNYSLIGKNDFYRRTILETSKKICNSIFSDVEKKENKIRLFRNISSAFGWGEPYISRDKNKIKVSLLTPFFINTTPSFLQFFFNSFLENLYDKKVKILKLSNSRFEYSFE